MCILHKELLSACPRVSLKIKRRRHIVFHLARGHGVSIYSSVCIIVRTYTGRDLGAIIVLILVALMELTHDGLVSRRLTSTVENEGLLCSRTLKGD